MPGKEDSVDGRLAAPKSGVVVRMYHTGFGDCFLLSLRADNGEPRYMLIDCGVIQRDATSKKRMESIARDIAKATGNKLHILVATHEHADHIDGFGYGENVFKEMEIDDLWLAWTEDPTNLLAKELKQHHDKKIKALQSAVAQLKAEQSAHAVGIESLLGFYMTSGVSLSNNTDIMAALRSWSKRKLERPQDYRQPGEAPLKIPDVKGAKCYILGPPMDAQRIKTLEDEKELYPKGAALTEETAFMAALAAAAEEEASEGDDQQFRFSSPFDKRFSIYKQDAGSDSHSEFFRKYYGLEETDEGPQWRRIETEWLAAADKLALSIDRMTNNTSLVFALELTQTQPSKVLLFVGDAQVGNWLSWQDLEWPDEGANHEKVTGKDLLKRTVFYKVGHHCSRNATLREKGLEMMESSQLVAMIPVDEEWAKTKSMPWSIPADELFKRLKVKTRGRVIRSDSIPTGETLTMPDESSKTEWKEFLKNLSWDKGPDRLWIQYTIR
jgi:hypothetical protein